MPDAAQQQDLSTGRLQRLSAALEEGRLQLVRRLVNSLSNAEIGDLLESLPPTKRLAVWELVAAENEGEVLAHVNDEVRSGLIDAMEAEDLVKAAGTLELDDLADILDDLPDEVIGQVLRAMDKENRERLAQVLQYPEDSAGGLMNPDVVTVRADVSLDVVLRYIKLRGELPELMDYLFIVERDGRYRGRLALSHLLTKDPGLTVSELADTSVAALPIDMPAQDVAARFEHYDLVSAPVVDEQGRLVGRITIDDVVDVIREEAEHSVLSMAGLDEEEDMFAPVLQSTARRAVWLGVNLLTAFFAAWVIGLFEATLSEIVALAVLMPIVASMGGIAGTQTLTLVIRGMALGQVGVANLRALLSKELAIGFLNGLLWALVVAAVAIAWFQRLDIGIIIAAAITLNLLAAALSGVIVPLALKRMNMDPALAGGVVLTTVTDVVGFLTFLGLGTIFLL